MNARHSELEQRVSGTLRAVGSQVHPADDAGFDRIRTELTEGEYVDGRTSPGPRLWLATAVLAVIGLSSGGLLLLQDRPTSDAGSSTEAADNSQASDQITGQENPANDGLPEKNLFLLPPTGTDVSQGLHFAVQPDPGEGEAIVVGRRTSTGFDSLAIIAHQQGPSFVDPTEDVELAGRSMIAPVADPLTNAGPSAAEQLPDGTWLEYTAGDGRQLMEQVAAATTFTDGRIRFDTAASGLEILGEVSDLSIWESTIVSHPIPGTEPIAADQDPFTLITTIGGSEAQLLSFGAHLGPMEATVVNDRPGFLIEVSREQTGLDYDVTAMAWSTIGGHSVLLITALDEPGARNFAAGLTPVDEETWLKTLEELTGTADRHRLATSTVNVDAEEIVVLLEDREVRAPVVADGIEGPLQVHSDPGTWNEYTTLELTWFEDQQEHRINFYVQSDGIDWWVDEIRTYDGNDNPEWITTEGEYFRTPLGEAYRGDFEIDHLRITGLTLEVFPRPSVCDTESSGVAIVPQMLTIDGVLGSDEAVTGYTATFRIVDTETCTPLSGDGLTAAAALSNPVAELNQGLLEDGVFRVDLTFVEAGEASLSVEIRDDSTREVLALVNVPVSIEAGP